MRQQTKSIPCTHAIEGMLKCLYLETPEYNYEGHRLQGDGYEFMRLKDRIRAHRPSLLSET